MKKLKVGILGIGAIGTSIAAELINNQQVDLLCYNRSLRSDLRIARDNAIQSLPVTVCTAPQSIKLDWLIICLKAHQYTKAHDWLCALITSKTKVVVIRNGIRLKQSVIDYASDQNILECIIDCPTQSMSDGMYQQFNRPKLTIPAATIAEEFIQLFNHTKTLVNVSSDFHSASWRKLCESAALGAILCLAGETTWIFNDNPKLKVLHRRLLQECVNVARADGAIISSNFIDELCKKLLLYPENKGSSMLSDRLAGKPIELMAKNGMVSELGKQYQLATPVNDFVCVLLERTNRGEI